MSPTLAAVAENPVIDQDWYAKELSMLETRLAAKFPHVPADVIAVAIELATRRIATPAKVSNYLPVLVERDVRAQLDTYGVPGPVPVHLPPAPVSIAPPAPAASQFTMAMQDSVLPAVLPPAF